MYNNLCKGTYFLNIKALFFIIFYVDKIFYKKLCSSKNKYYICRKIKMQ
jgi:hypothetical protein